MNASLHRVKKITLREVESYAGRRRGPTGCRYVKTTFQIKRL